MSDRGLRDEVARVLAEHRGGFSTGPYEADDGWRCACGVVLGDFPGAPSAIKEWETHIADALLPLIEARIEAARRDALIEAADDISENYYLLLPVGAEVGQQVMPDAWLRTRAGGTP